MKRGRGDKLIPAALQRERCLQAGPAFLWGHTHVDWEPLRGNRATCSGSFLAASSMKGGTCSGLEEMQLEQQEEVALGKRDG